MAKKSLRWLPLFCLLLASLTCGLWGAENLETQFDAANKLYEQGHYKEAAARYEQIVNGGKISATLYFNLGNAYYKSGQIGRAIACYRIAERLAPRDSEIRANLKLARATANGGQSVSGTTFPSLNILTLNELTIAAALLFWAWLALLIAAQLQPSLRSRLASYAKGVGAVAAIAILWLAAAAYARFGATPAVIVSREAVIRYGPLEESQEAYALHDGAEVTVLDQKKDWTQIRDASGRTGWVRSSQAARL